MASDDNKLSNRASRVFVCCCTPFVWRCGDGRSGGGGGGKGDSWNSGGGRFRYWGVVDVVETEVVDGLSSVSDTSGGGLRSLRMKRPLVTGVGGGGNSLEGLDEREEILMRSLVGGVEGVLGLVRKRRTPFMLMGSCAAPRMMCWRTRKRR
jgi:hypothetical protein